MKPILALLVLAALQESSATEKARPSSTPNLDRLATQNVALNRTESVQATDPTNHDVFQIDHFLTIRPTSTDEKFLFIMPGGDLYDLRIETERPRGPGRFTLRFPDHSVLSLRYQDPEKGVISYGKSVMPVNMNRSYKHQFTSDPALELRGALPESGRALVELIDHMRGGLCREAGLCANADVLLDFFRDEKDIEKLVSPDDENDRGWTVKTLSSGRTVDPLAN